MLFRRPERKRIGASVRKEVYARAGGKGEDE